MKKIVFFLCFVPGLLCGMKRGTYLAFTSSSAAGPSGDAAFFAAPRVCIRSDTIKDDYLWGLVYRSSHTQGNMWRCHQLTGASGFVSVNDISEALAEAIFENSEFLVRRVLGYASILSTKDIFSAFMMAMITRQVKIIQLFLHNQAILSMCGVDKLLKIAVEYDIEEVVQFLLSNKRNPVSYDACRAAMRVARLHNCAEIQHALIDYAATLPQPCFCKCCNIM